MGMESTDFTPETLSQMPKDDLVQMVIGLLNNQKEMAKNLEILTQQIAIMNQRTYGRKTESVSALQMSFDFGFNEPEAIADPAQSDPSLEEAAPARRKKKTQPKDNITKVTNYETVNLELPKEELDRIFGVDNYKRLPDKIIQKLEHHPASFKAIIYHQAVYAIKDQTKTEGRDPESTASIVCAPRPLELWPNSIATPSLIASIMMGKYVNAVPLYRQEQVYEKNEVFISRTTMANWMIKSADLYLKPYFNVLHDTLIKQHLLHADETPCQVIKDGRPAGSKSYMWCYRSSPESLDPQIVLYDYQKTRKADHPENFLNGFSGICVTDGYQAYHMLARKYPDHFKVAGCWVHLKRKFSEPVKAAGSGSPPPLAEEAVKRISQIFHEDKKLKDLPLEEQLTKRKELIEPLVNSFFEWVREKQRFVAPESATGKGFTYALNQEEFLRTFLTDPSVPLNNSAAERAIRPFTTGRKNWMFFDTIKGAEASAAIYSIVETGKANHLNLYAYLNYLLTELPKYIHEEKVDDLPEELFPWSDKFPVQLRKDGLKA